VQDRAIPPQWHLPMICWREMPSASIPLHINLKHRQKRRLFAPLILLKQLRLNPVVTVLRNHQLQLARLELRLHQEVPRSGFQNLLTFFRERERPRGAASYPVRRSPLIRMRSPGRCGGLRNLYCSDPALETDLHGLMGNGQTGRVTLPELAVAKLSQWPWWVVGADAGSGGVVSILARIATERRK
jgi:hypothetical protein